MVDLLVWVVVVLVLVLENVIMPRLGQNAKLIRSPMVIETHTHNR